MPIYKDKKRNTFYVKYKNITRRGFESKKEASDYEAKLKCNVVPIGVSEKHLFYDVIDDYLDTKKNSLSLTSYQKLEEIVQIYIKPLSKNININKYDELDCRKFRESIADMKLSTSHKNAILNNYKAIFRHAKHYFKLQGNPIAYLDSFKKKFEEKVQSKRREQCVWNYDEFNRFISKVDGEEYKALFIVLFFTGLRIGEALALNWNDFIGNKLLISKSMTKIMEDENFIIKETKNISSIRDVSLNQSVVDYLNDYKKEEMKKNGFSDSWFIFGGKQPLCRTNITRHKDKAIRRSGVKRITIHQFRHSHATNLINDGVNIVAVSRRLGHSDVSMTLKVYTHLFQKVDDELIENLEKSSHGLLTGQKVDER